jgi:hypothetical protein
VHHQVNSGERLADSAPIADVSGDRPHLVSHVGIHEGSDVQSDNLLPACRQKAAQVDTQEAGAAGDQKGLSQDVPPCMRSTVSLLP